MEIKTFVEVCKIVSEVKKAVKEGRSPSTNLIKLGGIMVRDFFLWLGLSPDFKVAFKTVVLSYLLSVSLFVIIYRELGFRELVFPLVIIVFYRLTLEVVSFAYGKHKYVKWYRKLREKLQREAQEEATYYVWTEFAQRCGRRTSESSIITIGGKKYAVYMVKCGVHPFKGTQQFVFVPVPVDEVKPSEFVEVFKLINSDAYSIYHVKWRLP